MTTCSNLHLRFMSVDNGASRDELREDTASGLDTEDKGADINKGLHPQFQLRQKEWKAGQRPYLG
jgi:hypothetical protein